MVQKKFQLTFKTRGWGQRPFEHSKHLKDRLGVRDPAFVGSWVTFFFKLSFSVPCFSDAFSEQRKKLKQILNKNGHPPAKFLTTEGRLKPTVKKTALLVLDGFP